MLAAVTPFIPKGKGRVPPLSVNGPADQVRGLCATCKEAYTWGMQHGRIGQTFHDHTLFTHVVMIGNTKPANAKKGIKTGNFIVQ